MSAEDLAKWTGRNKPGMPLFEGPQEIRDAFLGSKGVDWTASYIDPATWIGPSKTLVTATGQAFDQITRGGSGICAHLGITLREGGERIRIRQEQAEYETRLQLEQNAQKTKGRPFAYRDAAE